jgi:hypothetical protein
MPLPHIVLLGDSIFDNGAYTHGEPDVVTHLRDLMPEPWQATLLAVDGATIAGLPHQLREVPPSASHLVISIGGNDVLSHIDLLSLPVTSMLAALELLMERVEPFAETYRAMIANVLQKQRQVILCTIYEGQLERNVHRAAKAALSAFNDSILRTGAELKLPVIELRSVCRLPSDYANPIEPSGSGGRKIATAILEAVRAVVP